MGSHLFLSPLFGVSSLAPLLLRSPLYCLHDVATCVVMFSSSGLGSCFHYLVVPLALLVTLFMRFVSTLILVFHLYGSLVVGISPVHGDSQLHMFVLLMSPLHGGVLLWVAVPILLAHSSLGLGLLACPLLFHPFG